MRFVLIDQFIELEPGKRALARKVFGPDEDIFTDHFPGYPIVPGVLVTEAMGQVGGWLLASTLGFARWPLLSLVERAKFRRLVRPGDEILIDVAIRAAREEDFEIAAKASVRGERVAEARLLYHAFVFSLEPDAARRFESWARSVFREIGGEELLRGSGALSSSHE